LSRNGKDHIIIKPENITDMEKGGNMRPKWETIMTEYTDNPGSQYERVHTVGLHRLNIHGG
jgi:hypothetical protein